MQDFCYLDYHTEYSCNGKLNQEMLNCACFEYIFNHVNQAKISINYRIILYKDITLIHDYHESNYCLLTKNQLENHLRQAQRIYPFTFKIEENNEYYNENGNWSVFEVNLQLNDVLGTFHKYLLTWLRYTYEYPYNVLLVDTYRLKQEKQFKFTSIANLFNLVLSCCDYEDLRSIHQVPKVSSIPQSLKTKELKNKLTQITKLNELYKYLKNNSIDYIPDTIDELQQTDIEYWESQDIYDKYRKPVYLNVYKELKK